jgi:tetratricopeptide (TPR) repeat protein
MKTSRIREEKSSKKVIISGAIVVLATLCISLNSFPMTVEGADNAQDDQLQTGLAVRFDLELTSTKQVLSELALVHIKIAKAYADHEQFQKAIPWADRASRLDPTSLEAHLTSGIVNFRMRNTAQAIAAFEKSIELDASNFEAYFYLGRMYSGGKETDLAVAHLTQAIELAVSSEDLSTAYTYRALVYSATQRYEECFSDLDQAESIDPDNWMIELVRGKAVDSMDNYMNSASDQGGDQGSGIGLALGS